jgi:hypothetical protein
MTREHRLVLSLDEVTAVRWSCPRCRVAITYALTESIRLPSTCPACNDPLDDVPPDAMTAARAVVQALKGAQRAATLLSLEFLDPPDA